MASLNFGEGVTQRIAEVLVGGQNFPIGLELDDRQRSAECLKHTLAIRSVDFKSEHRISPNMQMPEIFIIPLIIEIGIEILLTKFQSRERLNPAANPVVGRISGVVFKQSLRPRLSSEFSRLPVGTCGNEAYDVTRITVVARRQKRSCMR
jgi:hypothetical protein